MEENPYQKTVNLLYALGIGRSRCYELLNEYGLPAVERSLVLMDELRQKEEPIEPLARIIQSVRSAQRTIFASPAPPQSASS